MVDLRSAAESVARAGDEAAHDTPIQEIESLCMRCGKNVSTPVAYLSLPVVSFGSIQCVCSGFLRFSLWLEHNEVAAYADPELSGGTSCAFPWPELLTLISTD